MGDPLMEDCDHCDGTGNCQDDFHGFDASRLILEDDCPSGCDGGICPHCNGSGNKLD